jgi:hypothetical protein
MSATTGAMGQRGTSRGAAVLRGLSWLAPLVIVLVVGLLFLYRNSSVPGLAPRPTSGLQDLQSLSDFQTRFNQDIGKPRLVVLLAPT